MKIYLDIDGVILNHEDGGQMDYVKEFLKCVFEISNGEVYWLSTLRDRSTSHVIDCLQPIMDDELYEMVSKIKHTEWNEYKTEGIDLNSEFLWFDDNIFQFEYRVLESIGKEHCLIKVSENLEELTNLLKEDPLK